MYFYTAERKLMGCRFRLGLVHQNSEQAVELIEIGIREIKRIEDLLSEFKPDSENTLINQHAGQKAVRISEETFSLIMRSNAISRLSQGTFDISAKSLKNLYSFKNSHFNFPAENIIKEALDKVGYENIELSETDKSVKFNAKGMQISFAAIGKGYASDRVKHLWLELGVTAGFIDASGDLNAFGNKPDGNPFTVGIANPENPSQSLFQIPIENVAIATSGDYEQHFTYQGKRYSHNINPHTGKPLTGLKSVSFVAPSAELADALATAVYVMGPERGLTFVEQLPQTHCVIIDEKNKTYFSSHISYNTINH